MPSSSKTPIQGNEDPHKYGKMVILKKERISVCVYFRMTERERERDEEEKA